MKIGHLESKPAVTPVTTERKGGAAESTSSAGQPAESSTHVALSAAASAMNVDGEASVFDQEKVDRIAQAIREGKFTIDAGAIADKLIANAQELLGRASH